MSNPTVSFRISDYQLARGLRAVRILEPAWKLTTTSDLIKTVFIDYIAKSEGQNKTSYNVTPELLQEIAQARLGLKQNQNNQLDMLPQLGQTKQRPEKSAQQIARELEEERMFQEMRRESLAKLAQEKLTAQAQQEKEIDDQIVLAAQTARRLISKPSEFNDPNITESEISSVTDFSPPKEWKE